MEKIQKWPSAGQGAYYESMNDKLSQVDRHARVVGKRDEHEWSINVKKFERDWCCRALRKDESDVQSTVPSPYPPDASTAP